MTSAKVKTFQDDPKYVEMLTSLQRGEWESALKQLDFLIESYPLENELRSFRQEIHLRAKFDQDEIHDLKTAKKRKLKRTALEMIVVVVVLGLFIYGATTAVSTIFEQFQVAIAAAEDELQKTTLEIKFDNAVSHLRAGYPETAKGIFDEILAEDPNYADEIEPYMAEIEAATTAQGQYERAVALVEEEKYNEANVIFEDLQEKYGNFEDVQAQLDNIESQFLLEDLLLNADLAFKERRWEDAIQKYLQIRGTNPNFEEAYTDEQLFQSYLSAGEAVLDNPESTLQDLQKVEDYFKAALSMRPRSEEALVRRQSVRRTLEERLFWAYVNTADQKLAENPAGLETLDLALGYYKKALELRPEDQYVLLKRDLAELFVKGHENFLLNKWKEAIEALEYVYSNDPEFAVGTARQTLYESYIGRGDSQMASGRHEDALEDYRKAAVLVEGDSAAMLQMFEAQVRIANALGALGEYDQAVAMYRAAVELTDFRQRILADNRALALKIDNAEVYAQNSNSIQAFRTYAEVLRQSDSIYEYVVHVVVKGEYLTKIAQQYKTSVSSIVKINDISNPNRIFEGQELKIPVLP